MNRNFNKFIGGVLPEPTKRYGYYPLDNERIIEVIGEDLLTGTGSAINEYNCLSEFMHGLNPEPNNIIEIGTFMGLGSALLASYCKRSVFTFDIVYRNSHHIWNDLEVDDRINCYCGEQDFIDMVINDLHHNQNLKFDFAFIDGMHKVEFVRHDFEMVKFCGRVLFHDCDIKEIGDFVINKLGGKIINYDTDEPAKFGYWEDK